MKNESKYDKFLDLGSWITLLVTIVLFAIAIFEKGLTHDLLLEAGIFLVSAKLVFAAHKSERQAANITKRLESIEAKLNQSLSRTPHS